MLEKVGCPRTSACDSRRLENKESILVTWSDCSSLVQTLHPTNVLPHLVTRSWSPRWTQTKHKRVDRQRLRCLQKCQECWSSLLDFQHALVYSQLPKCVDQCSKRPKHCQSDCDPLSSPNFLSKFRKALARNRAITLKNDWALIAYEERFAFICLGDF